MPVSSRKKDLWRQEKKKMKTLLSLLLGLAWIAYRVWYVLMLKMDVFED
jgi:hypothetical protein